eukprot:CAMPEP_0168536594 /NCGR_PEP_ID=MMETSP0405-20121227/19678_1 /TAXON_ID=498012 /ORGANISM="Trichosphaerium sp, Strain Am-I-7 wt" /LENGTH=228 /DNA_ID=CAMNT_0008564701 /DNA_START=68 /DNA_END=750 /DNA_ORIENTATION=+
MIPQFQSANVIPEIQDCEYITLQVIVKAKSYSMPANHSYEGFWHVEGTQTDNIKGVGLYYYNVSSNIQDCALRFRPRMVSYYFVDPVYQTSDDGIVTIKEGTCIAFSNEEFAHKASLMKNVSSTETADRAYLAFFIIDSEKPQKDTTTSLGHRSTMYHARFLSRLLGLPLLVTYRICEFANLGTSADSKNDALKFYSETKTNVLQYSGENASPGMKEGWMARDGGVMT